MRRIYKVQDSDLVLRDSVLHDEVTFNNQNDLNLIIDERIKYDREFILLPRSKVAAGITDPDDLLNIFNDVEIKIFFKQAFEFYYIDEAQYNILLSDKTKIYDLIMMNDIHEILFKQLGYKTRIPSMEDLENHGLYDSIVHVINNNSAVLINQTVVQNYTDNRVNQILNENVYLSFDNIEKILDIQSDMLHILAKDEVLSLMDRVKPYLSFITDIKIQELTTLLNNNDPDIIKIFSANEIKVILDKEVELKNKAIKTLTAEQMKELFKKFKLELINIELEPLIQQYFQILRTEMLGEDISSEVAAQVDIYLTNQYNDIINNTINKAFQKFKDEFVAVDLRETIKQYFDILKDELMGQDYTTIVENQVNSFLLNHFPTVTRSQVQAWIDDELKIIKG